MANSKFHHEEIYRGKNLTEKLAKHSLTVCGAGALGSNLIDNLTRQGFTGIKVIDMDRVEVHNLNTQVYADADVGALKVDALKNKIFRNIGAEIEAEGPNGTFVLDESEKGPHVLLAGGIGITPFRSMIKYNLDKNLGTKITLIYSCSIPEEIVFRQELEGYNDLTQSLKLFLTVSQPQNTKSGWTGLTGRIDESMINKIVPDYSSLNPTFWLCGPPPMVEAMEKVLGKINISSGKVRSEKFTGY